MAYELEIRKEEGFLYVSAKGVRTPDTISSMATEILEACIKHGIDKVLVDVRKLGGRLSIFDSFSIVVKEFPRITKSGAITKAALVEAEERRERYRFFETVARNRKYNIRAFEEIDAAAKWLCSNENNIST